MADAQSKRTMLAGLGAAKPRLVVEQDRGALDPPPRRPSGADSVRCLQMLCIRSAALGRLS